MAASYGRAAGGNGVRDPGQEDHEPGDGGRASDAGDPADPPATACDGDHPDPDRQQAGPPPVR